MSYMNDDCDPFGVPYLMGKPEKTKKEINYSFNDLDNIRIKELKLEKELVKIKKEKNEAIEQITQRLKKYLSAYAEITFDDHTNCEIIVDKFTLEKLNQMKEDMNLSGVSVTCIKNGIKITIR